MFTLVAGCLVEAGGTMTAHEIAERFAKEAGKGDAQTRRRLEERKADGHVRKANEDWRKVDEAEMLARARAEAEQRRVEMMRAREDAERADSQRMAEEEAKQAEAARKSEEDRLLAEAQRKAEEEARAVEAAQVAEAARKAEEERRLAEVRKAEEEARRAEALRKVEEERRIAEARAAEEARRQIEARRQAEDRIAEIRRAEEAARALEARRLAEVERVRLEAEREAEAQRLAERLRSAREEREVRAGAKTAAAREDHRDEQASVESARSATHQLNSDATSRDADFVAPKERRVTVLLLMQPGDRGIRRNNKSADPVLCGYHDCYVSNGPDGAASLLPARKALGFFRTWGRRAGACNNSLGCVFRGVDLEALDGVVMPVDMRVVRHDRREPQEVAATSECRLERGYLACRKGIHSNDYDMWLVPESLAARAGPAILMRALEEGLQEAERTASAPP
jgi:colicin import membrane protein